MRAGEAVLGLVVPLVRLKRAMKHVAEALCAARTWWCFRRIPGLGRATPLRRRRENGERRGKGGRGRDRRTRACAQGPQNRHPFLPELEFDLDVKIDIGYVIPIGGLL